MKLHIKLRWLLVGITLLCLGLAWVAHEVQLKNQLESLVLSGTAVTSAGLTHLRNLPSLKSLKLGAIRDGISNYEPIDLTDDGLRHLAQFSQLEELYLAGTRVGDEGLRLLADFPRLRTLGALAGYCV
jgi:hypothetical protein